MTGFVRHPYAAIAFVANVFLVSVRRKPNWQDR